jgi:GT2 family glycosyltransferase
MNFPMPDSSLKIAVVVPTIGRGDDLRRMLESLNKQSRLPNQVLIVGEGEDNVRVAAEFPRLAAQFMPLPGSSISEARNAGTMAAHADIQLIAFMDDDIVLEPDALAAMLRFWEAAPPEVGGASCNHMNHPAVFAAGLKSSKLVSWLGLYHPEKGAVLKSGVHTMIGVPGETIYVNWLPTYAAIYRRSVLAEFAFDPWFKGYSYLEDLDFSYRVSRKYKLAVVAESRFYHYPSHVGRPNSYKFGKKEVMNRLHFVKKHPELSVARGCVALSIRTLLSILSGLTTFDGEYFKRACGNIVGLASVVTQGTEPVA